MNVFRGHVSAILVANRRYTTEVTDELNPEWLATEVI